MPRGLERCPKLAHLGALNLLIAASVILANRAADAANLARMIRKIASVADDVPVQKIDEVVQNAETSRAGKEILKKKFGAGERLDNLAEESAVLRRAWKQVLGAADNQLREIESLPLPTQRAAFVVAHGSQRLKTAVPDLALRSRFLREGGAETLAALGRFEDLADDALKFDVALQAGKLPSPDGARALTLNDFGKFFHTLGERGHRFWTKSVRPNWHLWLGSAALAAVLLAPDEYLDAIGNLTEKGLEKVGHFGGKLLYKALKGAVCGLVTAGLVSAGTLFLALLLIISPTRRWIFESVRRMFRGRQPADSLPRPPQTP